jgi:hypothetical protein
MSYFVETYLNDVYPKLGDFITNARTGQNVSDVRLEYANRALKNLWMKKPWTDCAVDYDLVLTNNACALPSDFGRVIWMYADLDGTGAAGYMLWDSMDYGGYKIRNAFAKATGHSLALTFNYAQDSSITMIYQKLLEKLTGVSDEYLFFPASIMLLECQKIALREKGDLKELVAAEAAFNTEFKEFVNARQWVNQDPRGGFNDSQGNPIIMQSYSLDGRVSGTHRSRLEDKTLSFGIR